MRTFITICFLLLISNYSKAQGCGTIVDIGHEASLLKFDKTNWTYGNEIFNVKIYAHIIVNSSGAGVFTPADVELAIEGLNETFGPNTGGQQNIGNDVGVQFYLDPCIDYIEHDNFDLDISLNEREDGIDIYFYSSQGGKNWGGRASFGSSRLAIGGRFLENGTDPLALTNVLAHEVGHIFGLYHTWHNTGPWLCFDQTGELGCGTDGPNGVLPAYPEPVNIFTQNPPDIDIKSKTGDYIKDTPADPFNVFNSYLPSTYGCESVPEDMGQGFSVCNKKTNCEDHNGVVYEYTGSEKTMFNKNIMSYSHVKCLNLFSDDQISYMRHNLRGATPHLLNIHQPAQDYSVVDEYQLVDCSHNIDYNITIKNGGILEVTKTLYFSPGYGIIVENGGKLFLNGGVLTKALCTEDMWNGVQSNSGAVVEAQNGKIEYAITGIQYNHLHFTFYFSSPLRLTDLEIAHCNTGIKTEVAIGVLFLSLDHPMDQLNIHDCIVGFDAERTEYLTVNNSTFESNSEIGLKLSDGSLYLSSSNFLENRFGISYNNMGGSFLGSIIGGDAVKSNFFFDNGQGVVANAPFSNQKFEVSHNTFLGNFIGLNIAGLSLSDVHNNDFYEGLAGCGFTDGGGLENLVMDNYFASNIKGSGSAFNNLGLLYQTNCYTQNTQGDIHVNGKVKFSQGDQEFGASNTFSKIPGVNTFSLDQADDFLYFVKSGTPQTSEKYPSGIDDSIVESEDDTDPNCGSSVNPFPIINFRSCKCSDSDADNEARILELEEAIEDLKNGNTSANPIYKAILKSRYESCIEILEDCLNKSAEYNEFGIAPDGRDIKDKLDTRTYPLARVKTMSLLLSRGLYNDARSYLLAHSGDFDLDDSDRYEDLMNIYLDHIADRSGASVHQTTLELMADESNVYKGYARAMLCHYYNDCRYDEYDLEDGDPRIEEKEKDEFLKIFPNPVESIITIEVFEKSELSLWTIGGVKIDTYHLEAGAHKIDLSNFKSGIYFCRYKSSLYSKTKVVKIVKL